MYGETSSGLPVEEFEERAKKIRQGMEIRGLDALVVFSSNSGYVRYVSDFASESMVNYQLGLVVFPLEGDPTLFIRWAHRLPGTWFDDVRPASAPNLTSMVEDCRKVLKQKKLDSGKIGYVCANEKYVESPNDSIIASYLERVLPNVEDATDIVDRLREIKSPREIALARKASENNEVTVETIADAIRKGKTEFQAVADGEYAGRSRGTNYFQIIVGSSRNGACPFSRGRNVVIPRDSVTNLMMNQQIGGIYSQCHRTFVSGTTSSKLDRLHETVIDALKKGGDAIKPGNTFAEVATTLLQPLRDEGYYPKKGGIALLDPRTNRGAGRPGHSIGYDLSEYPYVTEDVKRKIEPGMLLVLHSIVFEPDIGGGCTCDTWFVTESGAERLHKSDWIIRV